MSLFFYEEEQFDLIKKAGELACKALDIACKEAKAGVSTWDIDIIVEEWIRSQGAIPTFKGYQGFPGTVCASINHEVVHGIPSKNKILKEGDIASFDIGVTINAEYKGKKFNYIGDNARTVAIGEISPRVKKLLEDTEESLYEGIKVCTMNNTIKDISIAVNNVAKKNNYGVVRMFGGHGVNSDYHCDPFIPNWPEYFDNTPDTKIQPGLILCIEPMFNLGSDDVKKQKDNWTIITADHKPSAHFEHTILVTKDGPIITTQI